MKNAGLFSVALGIIGLIAILYFNYQVSVDYDELGGVGELVTLFIYGRTNKIILYLLQIAGLTLGFNSGFMKKKTIGWLGFSICAFNLSILLSQSY